MAGRGRAPGDPARRRALRRQRRLATEPPELRRAEDRQRLARRAARHLCLRRQGPPDLRRQPGSGGPPDQRQLRAAERRQVHPLRLSGRLAGSGDLPGCRPRPGAWSSPASEPSGGQKALLYEAELADQSDYADNRTNVDVGYSNLMLGVSLPKVTIKLTRESLDGSSGKGRFQTPLATLHKFNGWADKFLSTPLFGLEDLYLQLSGKVGEVGWLVRVPRLRVRDPIGLATARSSTCSSLHLPEGVLWASRGRSTTPTRSRSTPTSGWSGRRTSSSDRTEVGWPHPPSLLGGAAGGTGADDRPNRVPGVGQTDLPRDPPPAAPPAPGTGSRPPPPPAEPQKT